ncbi:hypothetical protein LEN26_014344 [Aphanomyces euteiches]|nr:hypothetical protein LEN26_014344 [Aphanomyces euteiches]
MQAASPDIKRYFAHHSSQDFGSVYGDEESKSSSRNGFRRSLGNQDEVDHGPKSDSSLFGRTHYENAYPVKQTLSHYRSQNGGLASSMPAPEPLTKWKMSSSSRRTDTSSDEIVPVNEDTDDFIKVDTDLQMRLLRCHSSDERVKVYKQYVSKLLEELVMTETHSEELEYELGLKNETIEQLRQKIDDLTAFEKFQTLREFDDSAIFEQQRGSQGELRALLRKQEAEFRVYRDRTTAAEEERALLQNKLTAMEQQLSNYVMANRQLQTDLQNETKRREESNKKANMLREKLDSVRRSPQKTTSDLQDRLNDALAEASKFQSISEAHERLIGEQAATIDALNQRVCELEQAVQNATEECQSALIDKDAEIRRIQIDCRGQMEDIETKFRQSELLRRKLHNQVMELKGNIRVFCRVRPVLSNERAFGRQAPEVYMFPDYDKEKRRVVLIADSKTHTSYMQSSSNQDNGAKKWPFEFDQVFDWDATQEEMFEEVAALVQSAVDGYNVSIFAYGQTGSGKTYTMQGDEQALAEHNPSQWNQIPDLGIVGRTISHIFATCEKQREHGWEYHITFEMYEIYNESIRDLMTSPSASNREITAQLDGDGTVRVSNLTVFDLNDEVHAMQLLKQATMRRSVKKTNRNDVSSRSHCITTLKLSGHHAKSNSTRHGAVYLVDLAGSERLKTSGSGNDPVMLKEAQNINKSLASLGNVISAIASKKSHVPFRDTKLTYVLQNTLGRDSKTLMICTLSPLEEHREESLNTLRFAKKVNACELAAAANK